MIMAKNIPINIQTAINKNYASVKILKTHNKKKRNIIIRFLTLFVIAYFVYLPQVAWAQQDAQVVKSGHYIFELPMKWQKFKNNDLVNLQQQVEGQSKEIYKQYSGTVDSTRTVELIAFHIKKWEGSFVAVIMSMPPQPDLISILKQQAAEKMKWGIREGYIRSSSEVKPLNVNDFTGFYIIAVNKNGVFNVSGGAMHVEHPNEIIQLTLICPKEWNEASATDIFERIFKTIRLKSKTSSAMAPN